LPSPPSETEKTECDSDTNDDQSNNDKDTCYSTSVVEERATSSTAITSIVESAGWVVNIDGPGDDLSV
jgi:hypothetical protein